MTATFSRVLKLPASEYPVRLAVGRVKTLWDYSAWRLLSEVGAFPPPESSRETGTYHSHLIARLEKHSL